MPAGKCETVKTAAPAAFLGAGVRVPRRPAMRPLRSGFGGGRATASAPQQQTKDLWLTDTQINATVTMAENIKRDWESTKNELAR